jgi:isoquinoline 1-oxidoreductase subunit alpha
LIKLTINGREFEADAAEELPLLWFLREKLGLTGTKFGCGVAQCLACLVHVDGEPQPSCQLPVKSLAGKSITTIEGVGAAGLHPVQAAWIAGNVPQCGYCQSGMVMAAVALLKSIPQPTDADIDTHIRNICRCGTYPRIRAAIHAAAKAST